MSEGAGKGYRCRSYGKSYWGSAYWDRVCQEVSREAEKKSAPSIGGEGGNRSGNSPLPTTSPGDSGESGAEKPLKTSGDPTDEILRSGKRHDGIKK
jgi:hypothetical protein